MMKVELTDIELAAIIDALLFKARHAQEEQARELRALAIRLVERSVKKLDDA
jgi:alpha-D-ribose 1-methylphosphonate 5-triphosphate synthase subunit PhnG